MIVTLWDEDWPSPPQNSYHVLLVDDNPMDRKLYGDLLRHYGYVTTIVGSGQEAIQAVRTFTPRIAVVDVTMPGMDGIELCRHLRANIGNQMPIIFLSARDEISILHEALIVGGDDYIIKGTTLDVITQRIAYWCRFTSRDQADDARVKAISEVETALAIGATTPSRLH